MLKIAKNNKGVALVISLMMTLLALIIIMALLYMVTASSKQSGAVRRYHNSLEAAYGGNDVFVRDLLPQLLMNINNPVMSQAIISQFPQSYNMQVANDACLKVKLLQPTSQWALSAACGGQLDQTIKPASQPDMQFDMPAVSGSPYTVYTKIVDTAVGNTDMSGLQLEGDGVASSQQVTTPQHFPYVYRIEVQGQQKQNSTEQANISVLYAY